MTEQNRYLQRIANQGGKVRKRTLSHSRAPAQEESLAKRLKGMRTPASGAGDVKGDVRVRRVLRVEAKTTQHKSFSITLDMVRKIEAAAASGAELPAIVVEFNDGNGKPIAEVAVVPTYVLDTLAER